MTSCRSDYIKLNNGMELPPIGLGTYKCEDLVNVTKTSIDTGYRLIDTAYVYQNEKEIGEGIAQKIKDGTIKREDIFYFTKLWLTKFKPEKVIPNIKKSLSDSKLDYVDLYAMHGPIACKKVIGNKFTIFDIEEEDADVALEQTWLALEECVKQGYAKSIGFCNFNSQQIDRVLKICTIKPVVNLIEVNPYMNNKKLISFCKERNIAAIGYSNFYAPNRTGCVNTLGLNPFEEPVLKELAEKYKKTVAQVILRYVVQLGAVPVPKPDNISQLTENFDIFDFNLTAEDVVKVDSLNRNLRCTPVSKAKDFKEYPFNIEF